MTPLIVFLVILAGIAGFVGFIIWKVLKAPIPPPAPATDLPIEPMTETKPPATEPMLQVKQTEQVQGRIRPKNARVMDGKGHTAAEKAAFVAAAGFLPVGVIALGTVAYLGRRKAPLTGGDEDLGYKSNPSLGKGKDVPQLQVSILASGKIEVDGRLATMMQLEERLADLKGRGGKVWYYCEPAAQEPPQASQVLGEILRLGIPLTYSGEPHPSDGPRAEA